MVQHKLMEDLPPEKKRRYGNTVATEYETALVGIHQPGSSL